MSRFKALSPLLVSLAVLATVSGATAASTASTIATASNPLLGTKIVVDAAGYTVYHLTSESNGKVGCTGACRTLWPPLLLKATAKLVAGSGLSTLKLGTLKRPDGGVQVTYNHFALYLYNGDKKPGEVNGQGVGGKWYAVTPAGSVTKAALKQSGSGSALGGSSSGSGSSSSGSSGGSSSGTGSSGSSGGSGSGSGSGGSLGSAGSTQACGPGQSIPQGTYDGDGDDDNNGGVDDGDGCL